jgi:hypothetical protein
MLLPAEDGQISVAFGWQIFAGRRDKYLYFLANTPFAGIRGLRKGVESRLRAQSYSYAEGVFDP